MGGRQVRTVVPDFMYLEYKALYLELNASGVVPLRVAPAYGTRPVQAAAEGFTTADRKMLERIYRASVYGETPTAAKVVGDVRRRQIAYGVSLCKPSSRHVKGVSSYCAARQAVRQFEDEEGAYSSDEMASLAKAIRREYQKPADCPMT
jgi:hypothetical protein